MLENNGETERNVSKNGERANVKKIRDETHVRRVLKALGIDIGLWKQRNIIDMAAKNKLKEVQ